MNSITFDQFISVLKETLHPILLQFVHSVLDQQFITIHCSNNTRELTKLLKGQAKNIARFLQLYPSQADTFEAGFAHLLLLFVTAAHSVRQSREKIQFWIESLFGLLECLGSLSSPFGVSNSQVVIKHISDEWKKVKFSDDGLVFQTNQVCDRKINIHQAIFGF